MGQSNDEQHYSLKWSDYHHNMMTSFRELQDQEEFVDVTIAADGLSLQAHKVVLSACSPYFRKLLKVGVVEMAEVGGGGEKTRVEIFKIDGGLRW